MSFIFLYPAGAGDNTALTAEPVALANWEATRDIYTTGGVISYVYNTAAIDDDLYVLDSIPTYLSIFVGSVTVYALCRKTAAPASLFQILLRTLGSNDSSSTIEPSAVEYTLYSNVWHFNPTSGLPWTAEDLADLEIGVTLQNVSGARCANIYTKVEVNFLGEKISNSSSYQPSDVIHVNQGFSVVAKENQGRSLAGSSTLQIKYKDPDGVEGTLSGLVIDQNALFASVPAATNTKTGKWWFKLYAVLAGGEILEGVPFFTNVQPMWV
ncbi:MAG TPA: hypothetical protein VMV77_06150 [Bacteroidales bacterium]|nr:hypothetical protein [Bacteroidales bacterium]